MVSGGAILGDGCVGLILDAAALVHLEHDALKLVI
jgi:chemotaxis protein histidine kinase CheA